MASTEEFDERISNVLGDDGGHWVVQSHASDAGWSLSETALERLLRAAEAKQSLPEPIDPSEGHLNIIDAWVTPERKFFRTRVEIEVLSEDEPFHGDINELAYEIFEGEMVGGPVTYTSVEETPAEIATSLTQFESDPGFFGLDNEGNNIL